MQPGSLPWALQPLIGSGCGPAWYSSRWLWSPYCAAWRHSARSASPGSRWPSCGSCWARGAAEMEPHPAPAPALASLSDGSAAHRGRHSRGYRPGTRRDRAESERPRVHRTRRHAPAPDPAQRIDLRVSILEVVNDAVDAQAPVSGGVRLTVRWPARTHPIRQSVQSAAVSLRRAGSRRRTPACRPRSITIPASGAARNFFSTRASPPRPR